MLKVRTTKTASGKIAVQVVRRNHQETIVVRHIGSEGDGTELQNLYTLADQYILRNSSTKPLFPELFTPVKEHFVSLCVIKSIEILSKIPIRKVKDEIWKILDITLEDTKTRQKVVARMDTSQNEIAQLVDKLKRAHSTY